MILVIDHKKAIEVNYDLHYQASNQLTAPPCWLAYMGIEGTQGQGSISSISNLSLLSEPYVFDVCSM